MNGRHLHPVALPSPEPVMISTREEIIEWTAARRAVLTELLAAERRQLNLEDLERTAA